MWCSAFPRKSFEYVGKCLARNVVHSWGPPCSVRCLGTFSSQTAGSDRLAGRTLVAAFVRYLAGFTELSTREKEKAHAVF